MIRRVMPAACLLLITTGCTLFENDSVPMVPADNAFRTPSPTPPLDLKVPFTKEAGEAALRVNKVGQNVLAANQQVGLRPAFRVIGSPQEEIFHRGTSEIWLTAGMVNHCQTEGQLAAALCMELGKMVSEREALRGPRQAQAELEPPVEVRGGVNGPADMTRMAELAYFEKEHPRRDQQAASVLDPRSLARLYLIKANYPASDLDAITPLLRTAGQNGSLERQMNTGKPAEMQPDNGKQINGARQPAVGIAPN
jgi:hypothetical protein